MPDRDDLSREREQQLTREIWDRINALLDKGDSNDDALGVLVRRLAPKGPKGKSGAAAVHLEPEPHDHLNDVYPKSQPKPDDSSGNAAGFID